MNSAEDNIQEIIQGCRRQDRKAQELLYRSYFRAMMTLCVRYTRNDADAMEVMNTGFYKIYKNIDSYNPAKGTIYTWMRTIIINSCLAFNRSKANQTEWKEIDEAITADISPEVFHKMSAADILKLVRQLPPSTQTVFNLYVMEGFSHKEIAGLLHIREGTSKWHLSEARRILQDLIHQQRKSE